MKNEAAALVEADSRPEVKVPAASRSRWKKTLVVLIFAALGSSAVAWWAHALWRVTDWRVPLAYERGGDALFYLLLADSIDETGWYQENPRLGAPTGQEMYDWPGGYLPQFFALKLLSAFVDGPGAMVNAFYLLGWPLAGVVAAWVFLRLGVAPPFAAGLGVVFAALPAHMLRGESHLFLANLALVPPGVLVAYLIEERGLGARGRTLAWIFALVLGASETYYGYFACFLVLCGALAGWFRDRGARRFLDALGFAAACGIGFAISIAPTLLYGNPEVVARKAGDAEILGLKIAQLLLPVVDHRLPYLRDLSERYSSGGYAPGLLNESVASSLGAVGAVGLLILLLRLIGARARAPEGRSLATLSHLALAAILLGTVGGFGSLVALLVSSQIRGYNRISPFIGFLALAAVGLVLGPSPPRALPRFRSLAGWGLAACLALFAAWDQSSLSAVPRHQANTAEWALDRDWVGRAESVLPPGAMVFQLPYVAFPESIARNRLFNHDPIRPILHSRTIRWSYGAMKHRETDLWQRRVSQLEPASLLAEIRARGFAAIALDRWGYAENEQKFESELSGILGAPAVESSNRRWALYPLNAP
jgi:phosphoglycerol transferase